jgi:putative ABC transport system permease protein
VKYLHLVRKNLGRKKLRTLFTVLSILVAFVLFALLAALRVAFEGGVELAGADRLITIHKVSLIQPLPVSYESDIEAVDGVTAVAHASWFGGVYQDPKNFFGQMAVEPEEWLEMYPEYVLTEEERSAWLRDRTGAIVGRGLADRFGWEVGDRVPLQATIWTKKDGSRLWELTIDGIYDGAEEGTDTTQMFFHYDYFDEARQFGQGVVGWYVVRVADPERAAAVAEGVDALFRNSPAETKTATEKAFVQAFANQIGDVGAIVTGILAAVFFTMLLVAGNTMAQSVRERTSELGVLKTIGFTDGKVLGLVLAEALAISFLGGGLGLFLGAGIVSGVGAGLGQYLPAFYLRGADLGLGLALVALVGLAAGILPALQARRLDVVNALRRV